MSTVHVFVGQCGNQVGSAFLDTIASAAEASTDAAFQMRVSATHFRPALRTAPQRRRQQQAEKNERGDRSRTNDTSISASPREASTRAGVQPYYSLSRQSGDTSGAAAPDASLPQPRCVLVDMEPKVIDRTLIVTNAAPSSSDTLASSSSSSRRFYTLAPQQCVTRGEGSGNNWAFGYHQQGQSRRSAIAECLRREAEQQDTTVSTFHVLHSVAGGTGSGVSCLVAEEVRSLFPAATLLHSVVWPFQCGEVVTQWYNVLMAVSTLRDLADGVCITYNDVVADALKGSRANRGLRDAGEVSYPRINEHMSELLAPLHLPQLLYATPAPQKDLAKHRIAGSVVAASQASEVAPRRYATSTDVVEALALDPAMKFFTATAAPRLATGSTTWNAVLGEAARTAEHTFTTASAFPSGAAALSAAGFTLDASAFYLQHRSCLWALRGRHASTDGIRELRHLMATCRSSGAALFPLTSLFVSPSEDWRETPSRAPRPDHAAVLYGHTPGIGETFQQAAAKAEELLSVGAFVHHFERYGVSKAELRDAAAVLYDTAAAYGV